MSTQNILYFDRFYMYALSPVRASGIVTIIIIVPCNSKLTYPSGYSGTLYERVLLVLCCLMKKTTGQALVAFNDA